MTEAGDLCRRFAEECPAVAGIPVGDCVSEAIWNLRRTGGVSTEAAPPKLARRFRAAVDLARSAAEWGWQEAFDRILDRQNPSHRWGAPFFRLPLVTSADLLCTSTYENTARAPLRYASELPIRTVLGAWRWRAEAEWRAAGSCAFSLTPFLRGQSRAVRERTGLMCASFREGLEAIREEVPVRSRGALSALSELLEGPVASGLAGFTIALANAFDRLGPSAVAVGNEFAFTDRAALLMAQSVGLRTVAFAHGIFDGHYLDLPVLADLFVAWGGASERFILEAGVTARGRVLSVRPRWDSVKRQDRTPNRVVVFTQPVRFSDVSPVSYSEGIRSLCRDLVRHGIEVVLKPHPLEQVSDWHGVSAKVVGRREEVGALLDDAFAAVLFDSSVIVDVLLAGVPAVGIGWCESLYGERFENEGWLTRYPTPAEAVEGVLAIQREPRPVPDPLAGETPGGREYLREALRGGPLP